MDPPAVTPGVIRPARRPPGWIAPGPRPDPPESPELAPGPGEDLCCLAGDFRIFQRRDGHRWSADDLVTAWFAIRAVRRIGATGGALPRRIVDLGCGIGTVLLFLAWRFPDAVCTGIEAQDISAGMAARSIAWNGVADRCSVRHGDLRSPWLREGLGGADLVTGTPPYLPVGSGPESKRVQCGPCRFEHRGGIEDYCLAAAQLLAPGAPFVACAAGFQRKRAAAAAAAAGLTLTGWMDVLPKPGKPPLFAVFSMQRAAPFGLADGAPPRSLAGGAVAPGPTTAAPVSDERSLINQGTLFEEPPLLLRGPDGRFTVEHDLLRHEMGIPVER